MALIALDTVSGFNNGSGITSLTYPYTVGNVTDPILRVGVIASGTISGVTFNGVAMTQSGHVSLTLDDGGWTDLYTFVLRNPDKGSAHNIVISSGAGSIAIGSQAISHANALQTGSDDAVNAPAQSHSVSSNTGTLTSIKPNCWTVMYAQNDVGVMSAGAGTTQRGAATVSNWFDSNGPLAPGSHSLVAQWTGSGDSGCIIHSFAPSFLPSMLMVL